ncbi:NmrA-like family-domain-containing protein [Ilyonectria robusta]|uniref:NmrA-like family-domain-containing protein n=1 Tax=Ilyonectria robusta TaxID=1079257 RepID=UPI001E8D7240|nr:NmrA-like family-domain-containing protein [Ilyonectria robusta]KAH8661798.1 NmrA-like family-domain-containing protein [Ilyonectria robusta]
MEPQYNRIAVYGHRGWASSKILEALAASKAPIKVLYRPGSDVSGLPPHVSKEEVDVEDQAALVAALQTIDIVISLVGHEGVSRQHAFVKAIPHTKVQLFSPSDLAARYDEQGNRVPVNKSKLEVEVAAKEAGIPITVVLTGNFAEFALNTLAMGVDLVKNRIIFSANSGEESLNLCTRNYVGAAYASIFSSTPISDLKTGVIGLSELKATGNDITASFELKHGNKPEIFKHSSKKVEDEFEYAISNSIPFSLAWYCRKIWGAGQLETMTGTDIWEVPGYAKVSLEDLIVRGKIGAYREMPPPVVEYFDATFCNDER